MHEIEKDTAKKNFPEEFRFGRHRLHRSSVGALSVAGLSLLVASFSLWQSAAARDDAAETRLCANVAAKLDALSGTRGAAERGLNEVPSREEALKLRAELSVAKAELSAQTRVKNCLGKQEQHRTEATIDIVNDALRALGSLATSAPVASPPSPSSAPGPSAAPSPSSAPAPSPPAAAPGPSPAPDLPASPGRRS
ncbi:hypothetical protein [Streptomyces griseus]|uniref:hypothetical protein n=1 Tax=Streptomyces griseus TaxID=1911 RepID=UPI001112FBD2|nr:hypothetical protein [Streptomyces griseus]